MLLSAICYSLFVLVPFGRLVVAAANAEDADFGVLSKIEAERLTLDDSDFILEAVVHKMLRMLEEPAHEKGLTLTAEVAVPESEAGLVGPGQPATLKFNPFPGRSFHGTVERVAARIRQDGPERFVIAEVAIANPDGLLKTGMLGTAKVRVGTRRVITALFRP